MGLCIFLKEMKSNVSPRELLRENSSQIVSWRIFLALKRGRCSAVINFFLSRRTLHAIMKIFEKPFLFYFLAIVSFLVAPLSVILISVSAEVLVADTQIVLSYPDADILLD